MKHTVAILFALTSILTLVSCGGDDNQVNPDTSNVVTTTTSNRNNTLSSAESSLYNNLKSQISCQNSKRRKDVAFHMPLQQADSTKVCGQAASGAKSGTRGQIYFGVSTYGDVMMVTEIISGGNLVGHNITLSMCSQYINYYGQQVPLIGNERTLTDFRADTCMVLDKDTNCSYGFVDYASQTYMLSGPLKLQGYQVQPVPIYTSFTKPNVQCSQSY